MTILRPSKSLKKVIINADDFGLSPLVNKAIVMAFTKGLITSTSIMANMPGFEEACLLAKSPLLAGRVGVHLNLIDGKPLTESVLRFKSFCTAAGTFRGVRTTRFWLTPQEREAIDKELEAQVRLCMDRGIRPTHLDSHHHYHTEWPIGSVVIDVAKRNHIPAVRLSRNCSSSQSLLKRIYKSIFNARLNIYGLAKVRYFGSTSEVSLALQEGRGDIEIMVHPRLQEDGVLVDLDGKELEPAIRGLGIEDKLGDYKTVTEGF